MHEEPYKSVHPKVRPKPTTLGAFAKPPQENTMTEQRDWKLSDLAMVTYDDGAERLSILEGAGGSDYWLNIDHPEYRSAPMSAPARPVLVLDPEDGAQMRKLENYILKYEASGDFTFRYLAAREAVMKMIADERSAAEPQGLGAVVIAPGASGKKWHFVRCPSSALPGFPWVCTETGFRSKWADIIDPEVQSEGWVQ